MDESGDEIDEKVEGEDEKAVEVVVSSEERKRLNG